MVQHRILAIGDIYLRENIDGWNPPLPNSPYYMVKARVYRHVFDALVPIADAGYIKLDEIDGTS